MIEGVAGSKEFFLWITPADPADVTGKIPVVCGVQLGYYGYTEHSGVRITRRAPGIWLCLPYLARPRDGLYSHSRRTEGYEMPNPNSIRFPKCRLARNTIFELIVSTVTSSFLFQVH